MAWKPSQEERGLRRARDAEAREAAASYLETGSFSRNSLMDQLTSEYGEQFTKAQAAQAVKSVGL